MLMTRQSMQTHYKFKIILRWKEMKGNLFVYSGATASSSLNSFFFVSRFSTIASMTRSVCDTQVMGLVAVVILPIVSFTKASPAYE